ncbi:hypothetical protein [Mesorhizobium sp. M0203]|uniref:hypothetical protein n=1 Tax=Mesorhizobium sp. M0203 TaxID=2956912 RepID=UPI0033397F18
MFPYKQVVVLQVFLNFEIEHCGRELGTLRRFLGAKAHPCMHDKRHIAFVLTTNEEPAELLERLRPALEVDNFTNYTATLVLGKASGKHGGLNSLVTRINSAFAVLNGGPAKYLRDSQTFIEPNFRKSAPRKMGVERGGNR